MKKSLLIWVCSLALALGACGGDVGGILGSDPSNESEQSSQSGDISTPDDNSSMEDSSSKEDEEENYVEHVDEDNNGKCDECSQSVLATFDLFSVNDIHGKFVDNESQPGVEELTTYLKQAQSNNPNTILLSAGDTWQGMSQSNLTQGLIMTDWMNELGFASMAMGNHEFDWGEEAILANAELAEFPFLAINIFDSETRELVEYCQPSVMVSKKGVNIGIIGAIGDCYSSIAGDKRDGFYFVTGSSLTALVQAEAEKLRAEGADFIIYSVHEDMSGYSDGLSQYVDIVFEGHSHQAYVRTDGKGVYHLQGGGDNSGISHAQVVINYANESYKVQSAEVVRSSVYGAYDKDPLVDELLKKYADKISLADQVVGYNDTFRDSDYLCDKVAELYYQTGVETWGGQYDIVLGGAFLQARSPYDLAIGEIKYSDLHGIFPFDNQIVLCSISGSKLKSRFLNSTNGSYHTYVPADVYADLSANLDYNATYYMVTDTYTSTYSANGLTEVKRLDETTFARDLLAEYAREGGFGVKTEPQYKTIPELLEICANLAYNETSPAYYVAGKITSITSDSYGNMYIEDQQGNELYVYGTWDETGSTRYGKMVNKPQVGDVVTLFGAMKNYYNYNTSENILEMMNGWIVGWYSDFPDDSQGGNGEVALPEGDSYITISQAIEIGNSLAHQTQTEDRFYIEGTVLNILDDDYGHMEIMDEAGNEIYVYGTFDAEGVERYGDIQNPPVQWDEVTLYAFVGNYDGARLQYAWIVESSSYPMADPYVNMTAAEFYANYTVATSALDAYYRSQHGFMSGELTVPDLAPTVSEYQPKKDGDYIRNSQTLYSEDGKAYTVVDAYGNEAFTIYRDGGYITLEEVAAYVYAFGDFPANHSADKKAKPTGSIWGEYLRVNHTKFSGDTNKYPYEPELPNISGCGGSLQYYEMDIGTTGKGTTSAYPSGAYNNGSSITRGAARIVYGKNDLDRDGVYELGEWHVFYTYNHYHDFQEYLNYEGGWGEIFGNHTGGGVGVPTPYEEIYMGLLTEEDNTPSTPSTQYPLTSIPEIIALGEGLEINDATAQEYYVKGVIIDTPNATWGNLTIQDENGNTLWIYGVYDEDGNRYDAMTEKPKKGDTVVLCGVIMHYYNPSTGEEKIEITQATVVSIS